MANITFSGPTLPKDVTVYAVAGDRGTLLSVARKHDLGIPFQCTDGDCGSCLIKVTYQGTAKPKAVALTEKEKVTLSINGKMDKATLHEIETNDLPPPYRLACQFFVPDEDILVEFSGEPGVEIDLRRGAAATPA